MKKNFLFLITLCLVVISCQTATKDSAVKKDFTYPKTKKIDHVDTYHGVEVPDPYRWLEDDLADDTKTWVTAQNDVTFSYLNSIPFKGELQSRIEKLNDYEKISAPFKEGAYEYFYKNDGLQDHSVVYRTPVEDEKAKPEVFLDPNNFSKDGTVALRSIIFTEDGTLTAHLISEGG